MSNKRQHSILSSAIKLLSNNSTPSRTQKAKFAKIKILDKKSLSKIGTNVSLTEYLNVPQDNVNESNIISRESQILQYKAISNSSKPPMPQSSKF